MYFQHVLADNVRKFDSWFIDTMSQHAFTNSLIHNPTSKSITETLCVGFVLLFCYESLYWSGIYLGLWDYHAKEILKEVPVHCAHVYIKLNTAKRKDVGKVREYYQLKKESPYNLWKWKLLNQQAFEIFGLERFVTYHFEFGPEDFEQNPNPELGSTVEHLRERSLTTFLESNIPSKYFPDLHGLSSDAVLIFNNRSEEVNSSQNKTYLSQIYIETGNVIECVILL